MPGSLSCSHRNAFAGSWNEGGSIFLSVDRPFPLKSEVDVGRFFEAAAIVALRL
jgi:hypothetical protein